MTYKTYAGVGSRQTPYEIRQHMTAAASMLSAMGFILRTGGAKGADQAFMRGAPIVKTELFLPWQGYNDFHSPMPEPSREAYRLAEQAHPAWERCSDGARKMHARNAQIVLGEALNAPVRFVMCWTFKGDARGGTGLAIRLAQAAQIPVFNLGGMTLEEIEIGIQPYLE